MKIIFTVLFCLATMGLFAQDITDSATGLTFPKDVSFQHNGKEYHLQATGVATRKKFFIKLYSVASYLQEGTDATKENKFDVFLQDKYAKQLSLKFVTGLYADQVKNGYLDSFQNSIPANEYNELKGEIDKFLKFIDRGVNSGDLYVLRWAPGGFVEVVINGKTAGSLTNVKFAEALWSLYFGPNSVVNRDNLVSLMK